MAVAPVNLSTEDKNYIRLQLLSSKVGTEVVRDFLGGTTYLCDANIAATLRAKKADTTALRRQGRINGNQWRLLYPLGGAVIDTNTFDLTLMILLIRNLGNLRAPSSFNWNNLPIAADTSNYHDLARIKFYRNKLAHLSSCITDADFTTDWKDLSDAIIRLAPATKKADLRVKVDHLERVPFNQDDLVESLKDLQNICNEVSAYMMGLEDKLDEMIDNLNDKTKEQTEEILKCINDNAEIVKDAIETTSKDITDTIIQESTKAVADLKIDLEVNRQQIVESVSRNSQQQLDNQTKKFKEYLDKLKNCQSDQKPSMIPDKGSLDAFARELKKSYRTKYAKVPFVQAGESPKMFDVVSNLYMPVDLTPLDIRCSEIAQGGDCTSMITGAKDTSEITTLLSPENNPNKLPILIEADAGVGKTTLFHHLALEWANESETTQNFKLVILIPLRRVKSNSLVDIICDDLKLLPSDFKEDLKKCLFMNKPDILFLLDGLDEATLGPECDLAKLMQEQGGHLMCSSRPLLDGENHKYFASGQCLHIKLLGFSDITLSKYIQQFFENTKHKKDIDAARIAEKIMTESRKHLFCKAIIKIPLYAGLFCYLWEEGTGTFPHTATQVFNRFLIEVLNTYCIRHSSSDKVMFDKSPFEETVPADVRRLLKAVSELAYTTMMEKRLEFSANYLKRFDLRLSEIRKIGLFTVEDEGDVVFFRHKMFHEYFSGLYLTFHPELVYTLFAQDKKEIIERSHLLQNAFFFAAGLSDDTYQRIVFALNQRECMSFRMQNRSQLDVDTKCPHCTSVVWSIANLDLPNGKAKSLDKNEDSLHVLIFFIQLLFEHNNIHDNQDIKGSLSTIPIHCSSSHSLAAIFHILGFDSAETFQAYQGPNEERTTSMVLIDGPRNEKEDITGILKECSGIEDVKYLTLYNAGKQMMDEILEISWPYVRRICFQECDFVVQISTLQRSFPHLNMLLCDEKSFQNGINPPDNEGQLVGTDNFNNNIESVGTESGMNIYSIRYATQSKSPLYTKLKSVEPCASLKTMLDHFGKRYVDVYLETSYLVYNKQLVKESYRLCGKKSLHPDKILTGLCYHDHKAESDSIETVYEEDKRLLCVHRSSNESLSTYDVFCRNDTLHIHNPSIERLEIANKYYKARKDVYRLCLKNANKELLQAITKTDWQYIQLKECAASETSSFIKRLPQLKNIFSDQWIHQNVVDGNRDQEDIHLWIVQENMHSKCDSRMKYYYINCKACRDNPTSGTMIFAIPPESLDSITPQYTTSTLFSGKKIKSVCLYGGLPFRDPRQRHIETFICKLSNVEFLHTPFAISAPTISKVCKNNPNLQSVIMDLHHVPRSSRTGTYNVHLLIQSILEIFRLNGAQMSYTLGDAYSTRLIFKRLTRL